MLKSITLLCSSVFYLSTTFSATCSEDKNSFGGFEPGFLNRTASQTIPKKLEKQREIPISQKKEIDTGYGGLKKGFLSTPEPSMPKKVKKKGTTTSTTSTTSATSVTSTTAIAPIIPFTSSIFFPIPEAGVSEETVTTMWDSPVLYGPEARQNIYRFVLSSFQYPGVESYSQSLFSLEHELFESAYLSKPLFHQFLNLICDFHFSRDCNGARIMRGMSNQPDPLDLAVQSLTSRVIKAKFDYMNHLSSERKDAFQKEFITPDSDSDKGELVFLSNTMKTGHTKLRYFTHKSQNQGKIYRLYSLEAPDSERKTISLPHHPYIGAYQRGDASYKLNSGSFDSSGFILDKAYGLIDTPGIAITKGWMFEGDFMVYAYDKHPQLDQMFFFYKVIFTPKTIEKFPLINNLVNTLGGVEELDKTKFLFLPHPNPETDTSINPSHAEFLLPYASLLIEEMKQEQISDNSEKIERLAAFIEKLEMSLVDDILQKDDSLLEQECANEIASKCIEECLQQPEHVLNLEIQEKSNVIYQSYTKPIKQKDDWEKKKKEKAKGEAIKSVKSEIIRTLPKETIQVLKKKKTLENVREKYIEKASQKTHFKTSEVDSILKKMRKELSLIGVNETEKKRTRGSHVGTEIMNLETGASTHLGKANRSQRRGYQSGTVKKIINSQIEDVISIAFK